MNYCGYCLWNNCRLKLTVRIMSDGSAGETAWRLVRISSLEIVVDRLLLIGRCCDIGEHRPLLIRRHCDIGENRSALIDWCCEIGDERGCATPPVGIERCAICESWPNPAPIYWLGVIARLIEATNNDDSITGWNNKADPPQEEIEKIQRTMDKAKSTLKIHNQ